MSELPIKAVLLDIDGVLVASWEPLDGASDAVAELRSSGYGVRFLTNTTSRTRSSIADALRDAGIEVDDDEISTATSATAAHLAREHPGCRVLLLDDGPIDDLGDVDLVDVDDDPEVVVLGGAGPRFGWEQLSRLAALVAEGAPFVAMHGSAVWQTSDGLRLDTGAFATAIEAATGIAPTVVGKPAPVMFTDALAELGCDPGAAVMVGDDVRSDVLAAQDAGLTGVLVRTGKFRPELLEAAEGEPDHVVDSIVDVPALLAGLR
ncbi:MAG: TIGR01458 family HAD-type hydrolase [Actinobacteria bacterium]|nr:TIGR01458 family HAD-type hydrolase [Actinomycetota bacterium]